MIPRLIHPVPVIITQIAISETIYDEDAREPVQQASRESSVTVPGQVKWSTAAEIDMTALGVAPKTMGYVLFRRADLTTAAVDLKEGDRFTSIGGILCNVLIDKLEYTAHYTDVGGPTLLKAWFTDATPTENG